MKRDVDKAERIYWARTRVGKNTWEGLDDEARCAFFSVTKGVMQPVGRWTNDSWVMGILAVGLPVFF